MTNAQSIRVTSCVKPKVDNLRVINAKKLIDVDLAKKLSFDNIELCEYNKQGYFSIKIPLKGIAKIEGQDFLLCMGKGNEIKKMVILKSDISKNGERQRIIRRGDDKVEIRRITLTKDRKVIIDPSPSPMIPAPNEILSVPTFGECVANAENELHSDPISYIACAFNPCELAILVACAFLL